MRPVWASATMTASRTRSKRSPIPRSCGRRAWSLMGRRRLLLVLIGGLQEQAVTLCFQAKSCPRLSQHLPSSNDGTQRDFMHSQIERCDLPTIKRITDGARTRDLRSHDPARGVAEGCAPLQIPHIQAAFSSPACPVLRSRWLVNNPECQAGGEWKL